MGSGVTRTLSCSALSGAYLPLVMWPVLVITAWPPMSLTVQAYANVLGCAAGLPHTNVCDADPVLSSVAHETVSVNVWE